MSERIVGYCGIVCSECPILLATRRGDDAAKELVAEALTSHYGREYGPRDIDCEGCPTSGARLWSRCEACEARKCARKRNVELCSSCPDYRCAKLPRQAAGDTDGDSIWAKTRHDLSKS